ncbi:DNA polymerase-3 subunit epsilon [Humitalea rosea]|uniref:DNA polymerase III subunit epsilon n=1 Tax=Humitalea rosea TaxID=990373 RepID=A0A2W7IDT7_9PROT|nr:DNA polymerase III subunit epsilon [Humitalea rosea]PZW44891.1 DNA polymerase-3 subunit epsilon [Humitalea rosea]
MREIVLDTETTGLDPLLGDRVIEVAAIELENLLPTGRTFHCLVDPERDIPAEATKVHGFTRDDLRGKPLFFKIVAEMMEFLGDAPIIAHNAPFDFGFLDAELKRAGQKPLDRSRMVDTYAIARERYPAAPNSLDALCRRFEIDLSERTTHNALLDVQLLARVYLELRGGRQPGLTLAANAAQEDDAPIAVIAGLAGPRVPRPILLDAATLAAHAAFVAKLKDPLWQQPPFAAATPGG